MLTYLTCISHLCRWPKSGGTEFIMKKLTTSLTMVALVLILLTACGSDGQVILPKDGYATGAAGDTMRTYFFDFTVDSAYTSSKYEGYIPTPGYDLLAVEITLKNTLAESIPMFDWDFIVLYDDTAGEEKVYDYPITSYEDVDIPQAALETLLPAEYNLEKGESRTGLLLFEVPAGDTEFTISYTESFDDDTTGDTFSVDVTATRR